MKNEKLKIKILILLLLTIFPFFIQAALVPCGGPGQPACQLCHLFILFDNVIDFLFTKIFPPIALLMIFLGGFYMLTALGDLHKIQQAKSIITATVIGLAVIFGALMFLYTFLNAIGVAEWTGLKGAWFGNWWEIKCP